MLFIITHKGSAFSTDTHKFLYSPLSRSKVLPTTSKGLFQELLRHASESLYALLDVTQVSLSDIAVLESIKTTESVNATSKWSQQ